MQETISPLYDIRVTPVAQSRVSDVDFSNIPFGKVYADHMFVADYRNGEWVNSEIVPYGEVPLLPAVSALHYGQSIFEGMKAYRGSDGVNRMFRPLMNWERLNKSAERMAMPAIPEDLFMGALEHLIRLDKDWIPTTPDSSLYIRPFMFATEEYIGIRPASSFKFIVFCCPVGPYYSKPVKVLVSDYYVRAFKGGTGQAKAAGNYAATMKPMAEAQRKGYDQLLWLDGRDFNTVQEIGTMNVFFQIGDEVITPSTSSGDILEGITRDSVIQLLREKGINVTERRIRFDEITEAYHGGYLHDAFGTGTAATISSIAEFGFRDERMVLAPPASREISVMLKAELSAIRRGESPDIFGWMHEVRD